MDVFMELIIILVLIYIHFVIVKFSMIKWIFLTNILIDVLDYELIAEI